MDERENKFPEYKAMSPEEKLAYLSAMRQWSASLKRVDLTESDRVRGALLAYQRQIIAFEIADDFEAGNSEWAASFVA